MADLLTEILKPLVKDWIIDEIEDRFLEMGRSRLIEFVTAKLPWMAPSLVKQLSDSELAGLAQMVARGFKIGPKDLPRLFEHLKLSYFTIPPHGFALAHEPNVAFLSRDVHDVVREAVFEIARRLRQVNDDASGAFIYAFDMFRKGKSLAGGPAPSPWRYWIYQSRPQRSGGRRSCPETGEKCPTIPRDRTLPTLKKP